MFVNLGATPEQIKLIEADPIYKQGLLGDKYFEPFVRETLDETGAASATQIALHHASKDRANGEGFVKAFSVVAEDYANAIANNPQAAHNIHQTAKRLHADGVFNGILNPLEDPSIDATKPVPNPLYRKDCVDTDGTVYPAFEAYPANATYAQMREVKNANKLKLLQRFSAQDVTIVTGDPARKANINPEAKDVYDGPVIKPELMDLIKQGKGDEVPLFVSWGRLDTQKGFDIATDAFKKFAKTPEGKNAILVVGAGLVSGNNESKVVEDEITEMLKDPDLQGRVVHIDGWAPAYALASAADAALFTSRFEPCGLTDIEAMKYYCTPIVTNTQGFKQKNFDPRNEEEAHKATSFKTQHEFDLLKSQVQMIIDAYVNGDKSAMADVRREFPCFATEEGYDETLFKSFAKEYSEFMDAKKQKLAVQYGEEKNFPKGWNDWDELSKEYEFKYAGFARDLKDGILKEETAQAIKAFSETPADTKAKMFENLKALRTDWKGNANLHPTNESSFEMYKKQHMLSKYSEPTKVDVIAKDTDEIKEIIEGGQKLDLYDRTEKYTLGALVASVPIILSKLKKSGIKGPEAELRKQIAELQQKLVDQDSLRSQISMLENKITNAAATNKRNLLIVGAASAIGAAALTMLVSKISQKRAAKANEAKLASAPVAQPKEEVKAEPKQTTTSATATAGLPSGNLFAHFSQLV